MISNTSQDAAFLARFSQFVSMDDWLKINVTPPVSLANSEIVDGAFLADLKAFFNTSQFAKQWFYSNHMGKELDTSYQMELCEPVAELVGEGHNEGIPFWASFAFMTPPGLTGNKMIASFNDGNDLVWLDGTNDVLSIRILRDKKEVILWTDNAPTERGSWRRLVGHFDISGKETDFCKIWLDGIHVVDYVGLIDSVGTGCDLFLYKGITLFQNVEESDDSLASRIYSPLLLT